MKWFRFYSEALHDPKVQRLSPALFKHWVNLLCLACERDDEGRLPETVDDIAFLLRIKPSEAQSVMTQLRRAGLIDTTPEGRDYPHNWPQRQRQSDDVAARVRRHRAASGPSSGRESAAQSPDSVGGNSREPGNKAALSHDGNDPVTLHVTLQKRSVEEDTDTDTDTDHVDVDVDAGVGGASAPVVGGEELAPSKKKGDAPETRPPLALVPQVARGATSDASELAAFIPLARRVAETAKLTTYDTYAMARAIRKHRTHDPDTLLLEAAKAAEWIANKQTGKARRQMTVGFLDNWFGKVNNLPPEGDHHATTYRASAANAYAGRGAARSATQQPDPHKDGIYAAFVD
jgi:hypothetical protein